MDTKVVVIDENNIDYALIDEAGKIIKNGGLVAFPTETVYGLGGDALNPDSSKKIYAAKGRPSDNPLIVHIAEFSMLDKIVDTIPEAAYKLSDKFWPGPLTMIFKKKDLVPLETTGGLETVAVRLPSNPIARAFIKAAGGYVAAPSANISGRPSPTVAKYVCEDMDGRIEMIIDGGQCEVGLESTIIDLTDEKPVILRPGFVTQAMLEEAVAEEVLWDPAIVDADCKTPPKAPGMRYRHYAPKASLTIVEGKTENVIDYINKAGNSVPGKKVGVIATDETESEYDEHFIVKSLGKRNNEADAAHFLFAILREFDDEDTDIIFSESFEGNGVARATMNRLVKAAGHQVVTV